MLHWLWFAVLVEFFGHLKPSIYTFFFIVFYIFRNFNKKKRRKISDIFQMGFTGMVLHGRSVFSILSFTPFHTPAPDSLMQTAPLPFGIYGGGTWDV